MKLARFKNEGRQRSLDNEIEERVEVDLSLPPFSLPPPVIRVIEAIAKEGGYSIGEVVEELINIIKFLYEMPKFL